MIYPDLPCQGRSIFYFNRSLGDRTAQSVGVIPDPEVSEITLTARDKFLVIASDGVWEFMENTEVARIVWPFYSKCAPEAAANALVKEAFNHWRKEEEVIDDITCVIIFLVNHDL
jgi:serine/threonine protein phosphatase PrpC